MPSARELVEARVVTGRRVGWFCPERGRCILVYHCFFLLVLFLSRYQHEMGRLFILVNSSLESRYVKGTRLKTVITYFQAVKHGGILSEGNVPASGLVWLQLLTMLFGITGVEDAWILAWGGFGCNEFPNAIPAWLSIPQLPLACIWFIKPVRWLVVPGLVPWTKLVFVFWQCTPSPRKGKLCASEFWRLPGFILVSAKCIWLPEQGKAVLELPQLVVLLLLMWELWQLMDWSSWDIELMGKELWLCFLIKSDPALETPELSNWDCLSKLSTVVVGCFLFLRGSFCWDINLSLSAARPLCPSVVGRSALAAGGNMVFKVLCPSLLPPLATGPELLLLLLLLPASLFWFASCALAAAESKLLAGKEAALCWFKIWFKGIPSKPGWLFKEPLPADAVEKTALFGGFNTLLIPAINGLGMSLYWFSPSCLVEGLDGMDGLGDPIVDLGDLGGTLIPLQDDCGPTGGSRKFPWSDDVEEERDLWGEASILPIPDPIMWTGDVTGEGEREVEAECWTLWTWLPWFMWPGFTVGKGRLLGKGTTAGGMLTFITGTWEWMFVWKVVGLMMTGFWFTGLLGIGSRMPSGSFSDVNGFFWRAQEGGGGGGGGPWGGLWWNIARGISIPVEKLHMGFFITGLFVVKVGERGILVLPAIAQDDCMGEPCSITDGGDRGVLFMWIGLELGAPWKLGLFLVKTSGLPSGSVLGEIEPSPYICDPDEAGLGIPPWLPRYGDFCPSSLLPNLCLG